jgi:hypothetical protein
MEKRLRITPYLLVFFIALLFVGFGCSETFYDQKAGDRITPDQHYKSITDAEISLVGAMIPLQDIMPRLILLDGLRSDMMDIVPERADANLAELSNNTQAISVANPYIDPSDLYKVIINVNEVLANIDKVKATDRNFDDFILHYVRGGLIAMRSWSYLMIVRLYGEAAYIGDNMVSLPSDLQQNIMSRDVMIDTLINQLIPYIHDPDAETEFVELQIGNYPNTKALLGELYLEKNMYAEAAVYLKMACESYGNGLTTYKVDKTYTAEAWRNIFTAGENGFNENIGVIPFSSTEGQVNPLTQWTLYSDQYLVKPSNVLIDSFQNQVQQLNAVMGDVTRGITVSYDTSFTGEPFILKYGLDLGEPYSSDIIFIRAADVHLMLAEALNRSGDPATALILLNAGINSLSPKPAPYSRWNGNLGVRGRALLQARVIPAEVTGDAMTELIEDYIIAERAMELAFEGRRWFDLVRSAKRRNNPDYLASRVAAKYSEPQYSQVRAYLGNEANWNLPYKK